MNQNMKNLSVSLAALVAGAALSTQAYAQVSTPVVGFSQTVVKGTGTSGSSQFFSFIPVQFQKNKVFAGTGTASGASVSLNSATLTADSLAPIAGVPTHYLLIQSGASAGYFSDIVSNGTTSVTTQEDLSAHISGDGTTSLAIIPHIQLTEILGNGASLKVTGGATSATADGVYLVNSTGGIVQYYYKTGFSAGWRVASNNDPAGVVIVYPSESILVGRKSTSDVTNIFLSGVVPSQQMKSVLGPNGFTLAADAYPIQSLSLASLNAIVQRGGTSADADNIYVINQVTGSLEARYYKSGFGSGWRDGQNNPVSSSEPISNGFLFKRVASSPAVVTQSPTW